MARRYQRDAGGGDHRHNISDAATGTVRWVLGAYLGSHLASGPGSDPVNGVGARGYAPRYARGNPLTQYVMLEATLSYRYAGGDPLTLRVAAR